MIEKDFGSDNTTTYSVFNKIDNTITDNGLRSKSQYYDGTSEYVSFDKEPASETAETSSSERNIT